MIENPLWKNAEAEEKFKKTEFNFHVFLKTLIHKTSADPKLLQVKICLRNNHEERGLERISPVFNKLTD